MAIAECRLRSRSGMSSSRRAFSRVVAAAVPALSIQNIIPGPGAMLGRPKICYATRWLYYRYTNVRLSGCQVESSQGPELTLTTERYLAFGML